MDGIAKPFGAVNWCATTSVSMTDAPCSAKILATWVLPDPETQIERVKKRSGLTTAEIESILLTQATREQRQTLADDTINNGQQADLGALIKQVLELHRQWCNLEGYD